MFVSGLALKNSLEKYRKSKRKERYSALSSTKNASKTAVSGVYLAVALIFFVIELVVLYYAITIALSCSQKGPERVVNVILAALFPFPYVMLNLLLNNCAKTTLQGNPSLFNLRDSKFNDY